MQDTCKCFQTLKTKEHLLLRKSLKRWDLHPRPDLKVKDCSRQAGGEVGGIPCSADRRSSGVWGEGERRERWVRLEREGEMGWSGWGIWAFTPAIQSIRDPDLSWWEAGWPCWKTFFQPQGWGDVRRKNTKDAIRPNSFYLPEPYGSLIQQIFAKHLLYSRQSISYSWLYCLF